MLPEIAIETAKTPMRSIVPLPTIFRYDSRQVPPLGDIDIIYLGLRSDLDKICMDSSAVKSKKWRVVHEKLNIEQLLFDSSDARCNAAV